MAEQQLGPFLLEKKIGGGGMGVVYRAKYTKTGQIVALKLLAKELLEQPRLVARFERELAILKKLKHPHIVPCYGGGKLGTQQFLAMELVEGGSLATELKRRGRISWEETIAYGLQICSALEHAHLHGIIHRDLKPSNLLLTKEGTLKLADFGIARDCDATALTAAGRTVGTFLYMAPEQIRGDPPVSQKSDLYALGCVLFELLAGKPPFEAESSAEVLFQHLEKKPPRVASIALECPVWLDTLVGHLLEKDPSLRPRDASAVTLALTEIEQKVAEQASMSAHAVSGGPTAITVTADTAQVRRLLKAKKKRRKSESGPFWERSWFLAMCLVLVAAGVTWGVWPMSEDKLFEKARALMESSDPIDWDRARTNYLSSLQRRFPDGKYASQVEQYIDKIEMEKAEVRHRNNNRLGREPTSEGERLYAQGRQYEQFGDHVTALERYENMINLLENQPESRPFVNLARRQKAQIESSGVGRETRLKLVADALDRADQMYADGKTVEARKLWTSVVNLYGNNRELGPYVKRARAKLANPEATDEDQGTTE